MMIGINNSMKEFKPTYLYIKTHNTTGLKYFGKTTNDPYRYRGSGKYWLAHLKQHGYNVTTEVIGFFTNQEECTKAATLFSVENNIVAALNEHGKKVWANMIVENGTDGGNTGRTNYGPHTEEARRKMSESRKGSVPWNKGITGSTPGNKTPRSDETKQKLSAANLGKTQSTDTIEKRRRKLIGHPVLPDTREKISQKHKGKVLSEKTKEKLRNRTVTEETKKKIKAARKNQVFSNETKQKLSGKVVVVGKDGSTRKIPKEQYLNQAGEKNDWEWVSHRSKEAKMRR